MGNISRHAREEDLLNIFSSYGPCKLDLKTSFAFVEYENECHAEEALKHVHGRRIAGLLVNVEWSKKSTHFDATRRSLHRKRETWYPTVLASECRSTSANTLEPSVSRAVTDTALKSTAHNASRATSMSVSPSLNFPEEQQKSPLSVRSETEETTTAVLAASTPTHQQNTRQHHNSEAIHLNLAARLSSDPPHDDRAHIHTTPAQRAQSHKKNGTTIRTYKTPVTPVCPRLDDLRRTAATVQLFPKQRLLCDDTPEAQSYHAEFSTISSTSPFLPTQWVPSSHSRRLTTSSCCTPSTVPSIRSLASDETPNRPLPGSAFATHPVLPPLLPKAASAPPANLRKTSPPSAVHLPTLNYAPASHFPFPTTTLRRLPHIAPHSLTSFPSDSSALRNDSRASVYMEDKRHSRRTESYASHASSPSRLPSIHSVTDNTTLNDQRHPVNVCIRDTSQLHCRTQEIYCCQNDKERHYSRPQSEASSLESQNKRHPLVSSCICCCRHPLGNSLVDSRHTQAGISRAKRPRSRSHSCPLTTCALDATLYPTESEINSNYLNDIRPNRKRRPLSPTDCKRSLLPQEFQPLNLRVPVLPLDNTTRLESTTFCSCCRCPTVGTYCHSQLSAEQAANARYSHDSTVPSLPTPQKYQYRGCSGFHTPSAHTRSKSPVYVALSPSPPTSTGRRLRYMDSLVSNNTSSSRSNNNSPTFPQTKQYSLLNPYSKAYRGTCSTSYLDNGVSPLCISSRATSSSRARPIPNNTISLHRND